MSPPRQPRCERRSLSACQTRRPPFSWAAWNWLLEQGESFTVPDGVIALAHRPLTEPPTGALRLPRTRSAMLHPRFVTCSAMPETHPRCRNTARPIHGARLARASGLAVGNGGGDFANSWVCISFGEAAARPTIAAALVWWGNLEKADSGLRQGADRRTRHQFFRRIAASPAAIVIAIKTHNTMPKCAP